MAHKVTIQPECGLIQSEESAAGVYEVARGHEEEEEEEEVNLLPKKTSTNSYAGA